MPTVSPVVRRVDAHAHLDKYADDELDGIVAEIERGGTLTISVSVDPDSYRRACRIARRSRLVVPTFGIQPWEAPRFVNALDQLASHCASSPMIGEIGLDHRHVIDRASHRAQATVFAALLDVAVAQRKIVNVHSAGAERDVAAMLRARPLDRVIMHWYSGPADVMQTLLGRGHLFTIGAAVLHSDHIRDLAGRIPEEQLLTETDNPGGHQWLTGRPGRPDLLTSIESELARVRGTRPECIRRVVAANCDRLFRSDPHLDDWRPELEVLGRDAALAAPGGGSRSETKVSDEP